MNLARKISQLFFDFQEPPPWKPADGPIFDPTLPKEKSPSPPSNPKSWSLMRHSRKPVVSF